MTLNIRELDTVLAALRLWQAEAFSAPALTSGQLGWYWTAQARTRTQPAKATS